MRGVCLIACLVILQTWCIVPLHNIGYLSKGYDIFKGNPHNTRGGVDPGFGAPIFRFTYTRNQKTSDGRYKVPDNMKFIKNVGCQLSFSSQSVESLQEYEDALGVDVAVRFKGWGFKFSASADYRRTRNDMKNWHTKYFESSGTCTVYTGQCTTIAPPKLDYMFIQAIRNLPGTYNEDMYFEFLDFFGTHFVNKVVMGSKFGYQSKFSEVNYAKLQTEQFDTNAAASYSGFGISGSAKSMTTYQQQMVSKFNELKTNTYVFSLGSKPPANGQAYTWANQTILEPMPISYDLKEISTVLTCTFFPCKTAADTKHVELVKQHVEYAISQYCTYLLQYKLVFECNNSPVSSRTELPNEDMEGHTTAFLN